MPRLLRGHLGLKKDVLIGAVYTITFLDRGRTVKPPACFKWHGLNTQLLQEENGESVTCDEKGTIVESPLWFFGSLREWKKTTSKLKAMWHD